MIIKRIEKGSPLEFEEMDGNLTELETRITELEAKKHIQNSDAKLAAGTEDEVTAAEIRTHLDSHNIASVEGLQNALAGKEDAGVAQLLVNALEVSLKGGVSVDGDTLAKLRALVASLRTDLTTEQGKVSALQALVASDDLTLDTVQELVNYIKANKSLIDSVTLNKVDKADIVDNLNQATPGKVLDARQGAILKQLIDSKPSGGDQLPIYSTTEQIAISVSQEPVTENFTLVTATANADNTITFSNFDWTGTKLVYIFGYGAPQTDFTITDNNGFTYYFNQPIFASSTTTITVACTRTDDSQPFELRVQEGNLAIASGTLWNFSATVNVVQNPSIYKYVNLLMDAENGTMLSRYFGTNHADLILRNDFAILTYLANAKSISSFLAGEGGAILEHSNLQNGKPTVLRVGETGVNISARDVVINGDMQEPGVGGLRGAYNFSQYYTPEHYVQKAYVDSRINLLVGSNGGTGSIIPVKFSTFYEANGLVYDPDTKSLQKPKTFQDYQLWATSRVSDDAPYVLGTPYAYNFFTFRPFFDGYYIHPVTGVQHNFVEGGGDNPNDPLEYVYYAGNNDAQTINIYMADGTPIYYWTIVPDNYGYYYFDLNYLPDYPRKVTTHPIEANDIDYTDTPLVLGDRVVLMGQSDPVQNGVYYLSEVDVLSRTENEIIGGSIIVASEGYNKNKAFIVEGAGVRNLGVDAITFKFLSPDLRQYVDDKGEGIYLESKGSVAALKANNFDNPVPDANGVPVSYGGAVYLYNGFAALGYSEQEHVGNTGQGGEFQVGRDFIRMYSYGYGEGYCSFTVTPSGAAFYPSDEGSTGIQYATTNIHGQPLQTPITITPTTLVTREWVENYIDGSTQGTVNLSDYQSTEDINLETTKNIELKGFKTQISAEKPVANTPGTFDGSLVEVLAEGITIETNRYNADGYVNRGSLKTGNGTFYLSAETGLRIRYEDTNGNALPMIFQPDSAVTREYMENFVNGNKFITYLATINPGDVIAHNLGSADIIVQFRDENGASVNIPNVATTTTLTLNPAQTLTNIKIIAMK